jgi:hypothetical protein
VFEQRSVKRSPRSRLIPARPTKTKTFFGVLVVSSSSSNSSEMMPEWDGFVIPQMS